MNEILASAASIPMEAFVPLNLIRDSSQVKMERDKALKTVRALESKMSGLSCTGRALSEKDSKLKNAINKISKERNIAVAERAKALRELGALQRKPLKREAVDAVRMVGDQDLKVQKAEKDILALKNSLEANARAMQEKDKELRRLDLERRRTGQELTQALEKVRAAEARIANRNESILEKNKEIFRLRSNAQRMGAAISHEDTKSFEKATQMIARHTALARKLALASKARKTPLGSKTPLAPVASTLSKDRVVDGKDSRQAPKKADSALIDAEKERYLKLQRMLSEARKQVGGISKSESHFEQSMLIFNKWHANMKHSEDILRDMYAGSAFENMKAYLVKTWDRDRQNEIKSMRNTAARDSGLLQYMVIETDRVRRVWMAVADRLQAVPGSRVFSPYAGKQEITSA